jgi:formylglycine-generating enzyme
MSLDGQPAVLTPAAIESAPPFPGMVWVPGKTYLMGFDRHYPEERPTHRVAVDGFWMDRHPVTNDRFGRFVEATGHVTLAEIVPDPAQYPGALPHMLYAGSLLFVQPAGPADRSNIGNWWTFQRGADWRHPQGPPRLPLHRPSTQRHTAGNPA